MLLELKEYANEIVDVQFVRQAVRSIGECAIKLEAAAEKCIRVLLDLISFKVNAVVQEAIVVIKVCLSLLPSIFVCILDDLSALGFISVAGYFPKVPSSL